MRDGTKTALGVAALVLGLLLMLLLSAMTVVVDLDESSWAAWVGARVGGQVGLGLLIAGVGLRKAGMPLWLGLAVGGTFGLLMAWSATPDLLEGPVTLRGRVVENDIWTDSDKQISGEVCFESDTSVTLCLYPWGMKASRMSGELGRCKSGKARYVVLRHLDVLLDAECLPVDGAVDEGLWEAHRRWRMGGLVVNDLRALPAEQRELAAMALGTAETGILVGALYAASARDGWLIDAMEEALVLRTDYAALIAASRAVELFPEQASTLLARVEKRKGNNVGALRREIREAESSKRE